MELHVAFSICRGVVVTVLFATAAGCDSSGNSGGQRAAAPKTELWAVETPDHIQLYEYQKKNAKGEPIYHGRCIFKTKQDEKILDGYFVEGKENGLWRAWHRNGKLLFEGDYVLGAKNGEWVYWDAEGNEAKREQWMNGKMAVPLDPEKPTVGTPPTSTQPATTSQPLTTSAPASKSIDEMPTFGR